MRGCAGGAGHPGVRIQTIVQRMWWLLPDGRLKYRLYLQSPEWRMLRFLVRQRSGGWCERGCGRRARDIHHLTYDRLYHERLEDLMALCRGCHKRVHGQAWNRFAVALLLLILVIAIAIWA